MFELSGLGIYRSTKDKTTVTFNGTETITDFLLYISEINNLFKYQKKRMVCLFLIIEENEGKL